MAKDAYWFKHDSNASRDLKLMQIKAIYGLEGLGIYWSIIEVLREQNNYAWDEKMLQVLAKIIDCDTTKFSNFIADAKRIELLSIQDNYLVSNRLCRDMEVWESKKNNGSSGGVAKSKRNLSESLAKGKRERSIREEKRREDISVISISAEFENFWNLYDKKRGDKEKIEKKWRKLTDSDREAIMSYIPKYKQSQPDKKYRKDPETFLNNKSWNDELIESESVGEILPKSNGLPEVNMNDFFGTR